MFGGIWIWKGDEIMAENANAGKNQENGFSKGSIIKNILKLALPMAIA